jgi:transmembrane sensor
MATPGPDERPSREAQAWHARLRGEPSPADRRDFEHWYADPANMSAYDRIDADWTSRYGLLARTSAGRSRAGLAPSATRFEPSRRGWALACLAMLLFAGLLVLRPGSEPAVQAESIVTAVGEIRTVKLADRSEVILDTDSRIEVRHGPAERRVQLQRGRARFKVRGEPGRPFVVAAAGGEVIARGTSFDVDVRDGNATVVLIEGRVEVQSRTQAAPDGTRRALRPGDRVTMTSQGRLESIGAVAIEQLRWPIGMMVFRNTPLNDAARQANRYSRSRIVLGDAAVGRLRVTGTFQAGDTLGLARSLAAAFSLTLDVLPSGQIVLRASS